MSNVELSATHPILVTKKEQQIKNVTVLTSLYAQEFTNRYLCPLLRSSGPLLEPFDVSRPSDALMQAAVNNIRSYVFDIQMGAVTQKEDR